MALTKISTDGVQDDAVTAGKIPANAVGSSELADNAVDTAAVADDAINANKIANNAINADKIINGAINTAKLADQAVTLAKFVHGDSNNNGKFLRANNGADPTFETVNLVSDTSPQLGGDLQTNGNDIDFATNDKARFGAGHQLQVFHNGTDSAIVNYTGDLYIENDINTTNEKVFIRAKAGASSVNCLPEAAVELYFNGHKKFETMADGVILQDLQNNTIQVKLNTAQGTGGSIYANTAQSEFGFLTTSGEWAIRTINNGKVALYHDGGDPVCETSANGLAFPSGKGIDFSAASHAAGMTSELLDDYEEGTWTPTLSSGFSSISYHHQNGFYTKIGNVVYFTIYIYVYQATGANYPIQITLPFTSINETRRESGAYPAYDNGTFSSSWNEKAGCSYLIGAGSTIVQPIKRINGSQIYGNDSALGQGANNRYFHLAGHYYVP